MAKVMAVYGQPTDTEAFDKYYNEVHIPLAQKLPGLKSAGANRVIQAQNGEAYLIGYLEFADSSTLNQALSSPEWNEMLTDAGSRMFPLLNSPPSIFITE